MPQIETSLATAKQIRNRPIFVTVPNTDPPLRISCCRPDIAVLVAEGWLPLEQFEAVLAGMTSWADAETEAERNERIAKDYDAEPEKFTEFVNRWVCRAVLVPAVVLTSDEAKADETRLWIGEMELELKMLIFGATCKSVISQKAKGLLAEFRAQRAAGAGAGSDGPAVSRETVSVAGPA